MSELRLHLGCGDIRLDGWCNVDARPGPAVDKVADIADAASLAEPGTVDAIYACHVLEHFGFHYVAPRAEDVLRGWVWLLKPGGVVYISVPDLQAVGWALWQSNYVDAQFNFIKCIYGGCEYPQNRHFIGFTPMLLTRMMQRVGLVGITTFTPFAKDTSQFELHGCFVSLNLCGGHSYR